MAGCIITRNVQAISNLFGSVPPIPMPLIIYNHKSGVQNPL